MGYGAAFNPTRGLLWARDEALGKIRMVRIGSHSKAPCERLHKLSLVFRNYRKARLSRVELELGKTDNPMCCSLVQALRPRTLHVHRTDATQSDSTHASGKTTDSSRMGVGLLDKLFIQPPLLEADALGKRSGFGRLVVLLLPLHPPSHDIGKLPISISDSLTSRRYAAQIKALMAVSWDRLLVVSDNFNDPLTLLPNTPAMRARLQAAEWMENAIRKQIGDVMRGGVRTIPYTGPEVELMSIAAYRRSGMYEVEEDGVLSEHSKEAVEAVEAAAPASTPAVTEVVQGEAEEGMVVE